MVVLWSITTVAVLVICTGHPVRASNYRRKTILDNFVPTVGSLYNGWTRSKLECSNRCESVTGVRSLFYVQTTSTCECHGTQYPDTTGLSSAPSATYYEKQGAVATVFSCPPDNLSFRQVVLSDGSKFKYRAFVDMTRSFDDAVTKCSDEGATLFEVLTVTKFNFSMELMACPGYQTKHFWISGVYNSAASRWETRGGVPLPMSNTFWQIDRPNNNENGPCMWMSPMHDHKWDDRICANDSTLPTFTLCEMP